MNESTVPLLISVDESTDIVCSGVRLKGHAHPLVAVAVSKKRVHVLHGPELIPLRIVSLPACVCSLSFTVKRNKRAIASLAILCNGGLLFVVPCPLPEQMRCVRCSCGPYHRGFSLAPQGRLKTSEI